MQRASHACLRTPVLAVSLSSLRAREDLMPKRVNSFVPMILAVPLIPTLYFIVVVLAFVATTVVFTYGSARADSACIEAPSPPAAEGARWYLPSAPEKGRTCWFLRDSTTNVRAVATPQGQTNAAAAPTLSSRLA